MKLFTLFVIPAFFLAVNTALAEVNINTASAPELVKELKNVGPAKAAAIIEYRKIHGAFRSVDELALVHGIGKATLEMNRNVIVLEDARPGAADSAGETDMADSR